jgi:MmeI, DNA-methyltransferase domain
MFPDRLLPAQMFKRMLEQALSSPGDFQSMATDLFRAMKDGGRIGFEHVDWFNGALFDTDEAFPLEQKDLELVLSAAKRDWSDIDPSILGTLFERGLDPNKRAQLGAHYTDRNKISLIIEPVLIRPLQAKWAAIKTEITEEMEKYEAARTRRPTTQTAARRVHAAARREEERSWRKAKRLHESFIERLRKIRVLDPACGSGNFLYMALLALKDLEHKANLDAEVLGLGRFTPSVGPECVYGIEINGYAAELARVTVWIGEIQWMKKNGFDAARNPILRPLSTIENRDAVLGDDHKEAAWPEADFIIGNPPYLGDRWIIQELGQDYAGRLRASYVSRLPASANFVCYWFEKAAHALRTGRTRRVGFVATSTIRNPNTRFILQRMMAAGRLFEAWSNIVWIEGHGRSAQNAAVRVAITCYQAPNDPIEEPLRLDGTVVNQINADLSSRFADLTTARRLEENRGVAFQGVIPWGRGFVINGAAAREMLQEPLNVNGSPNSDVLLPYRNAVDLSRRSRDRWLIDMGTRSLQEAMLFERPFRHLEATVRVQRLRTGNQDAIDTWWRLWNPRPAMRSALHGLARYIATPRVSEHRFFVWLPSSVLPDSRLVAIARDDDAFFGLLHSRIHRVWTLAKVALHGVGDDPTYNSREIFETFPFPEILRPRESPANDPRVKAVAEAARNLVSLRDRWLNPADLVRMVPEVVDGFPARIVPIGADAQDLIRSRTLTEFYNNPPPWYEQVQAALDQAVASAYGWPSNLSDQDILERLLALNLMRDPIMTEDLRQEGDADRTGPDED